MPKVMVLFFGDADSSALDALVDAAASGAKSVRFTEVDVRAASATTTRHKSFASDRGFDDYDGVVLVAGADAESAAVASVFDGGQGAALGNLGNLGNLVLGVVGGSSAALDRLARSGGILVTDSSATGRPSGDARGRARALGARVAKVAGWVRHALGHEAEHAAASHHDQQHGHGHHHDHDHHDHHHGHDDAHGATAAAGDADPQR